MSPNNKKFKCSEMAYVINSSKKLFEQESLVSFVVLFKEILKASFSKIGIKYNPKYIWLK